MKSQISNVLIAPAFIIMIIAGGCTATLLNIKGPGGPIPLLLNEPSVEFEVVKDIKVSKRIVFYNTVSYDISEILFSELEEVEADAIINIVFTVKLTPSDQLINLITLGLADAKTIEITGQAVRIRGGSGALYIPEGETLAESENVNGIVPVLMQSAINGSPAMIVRVQGKDGETLYKLVRSNLNTNDR